MSNGRPRELRVFNPQSRFETVALEYDDGESPAAELEVYEDHSRTILATNDSPDVGFRWSVNPYRGCMHACAYCLVGSTRVLMADGSTRALEEIRPGDAIVGTKTAWDADGREHRRYVRTHVRAEWRTTRPAYRVVLRDGSELVASGDHRFLTTRGFVYVADAFGERRRRTLRRGDAMLGAGLVGEAASRPARTLDYDRGYLCALVYGDSLVCIASVAHRRREFQLALAEAPALRRAEEMLGSVAAVAAAHAVGDVRRTAAPLAASLAPAAAGPPSREWARGFLAGLFDVQGRAEHDGALVLAARDPTVRDMAERSLRRLGFALHHRDDGGVELRGGARERLRFFVTVDPAVRRKCSLDDVEVMTDGGLEVAAVEELGLDLPMFDVTTGTGDFVANGVVSHNCYARPSHEYLSFGAGTDFERRIVVKPNAPELLREAFDKTRWKGELVVFSGVTDCYQPLESKLRITRGCLEVCAEYKNPVGIITKSPVVERDVDVLRRLADEASVRVSVSVPFWDAGVARAMEPMVTTPERRMRIVETLAKAGIPVGVSVSPIVPGLNDEDIPRVLEAASRAGARHAFFVILRLPGAVKDVFERALRERLPLRADKVLRRLREIHGGKLYDSRYGQRQTGAGVYAETIASLFTHTAQRCGLAAGDEERFVAPSTFHRPDRTGQTSFGF